MRRKEDRILPCLCAVSFLFFVCSLLFPKADGSPPQPRTMSMLSPAGAEAVRAVSLSRGTRALLCARHDGVWIAEQDGRCAVADGKMLDSLVARLSKPRTVYKIADDYKSVMSHDLDEVLPFSLSFFDGDGNGLSEILFFASDFLTGRMSFASVRSKVLYESEDDVFSFLSADLNVWAAGEICAGIADPVLITFSSPSASGSVAEGEEGFADAARELLGVRHGRIAEAGPFSAPPALEVAVHGGNGRIVRVRVFSEGGDFFLSRMVVPSVVFDSGETAAGFLRENAVYEISGWTYSRLLDALGVSKGLSAH